jgi:hypothetical protein
MSNDRNGKTTHPQIRRRRERALERLEHGIKGDRNPYREDTRQKDIAALTHKLGQRKQGSATAFKANA